MKYIGSLLSLLAALALCGLIACGSLSPGTVAYKANTATVATANTALVAWGKYLQVQESDLIAKKHAGQDVSAAAAALDDKWSKVGDLWTKYQAAQAVAFAANRSLIVNTNATGVQAAIDAAGAAEQDFIAFVNSLTK